MFLSCLVFGHWKTSIRIVENDFDEGGDHSRARSFVKQRDSLFCSQIRVLVGKHELDRRKEVRLSRSISTDNDVMLRTEKVIQKSPILYNT